MYIKWAPGKDDVISAAREAIAALPSGPKGAQRGKKRSGGGGRGADGGKTKRQR
jgi:hypothetical protein